MFLVDGDRIGYVTAAFADWFGTDATSLTGQPARAVLAPADRAGFAAALARVRATDGWAETQYRCRLATDGEKLSVVLELVSLSGGAEVVGFVRTDAALEQTRDELATARDRFGHLFDLIQDAVVEVEIVDMVPVVRSVNPAFTEVFGYDAETVVGESLNEFIVPAERGAQAVDFDRRTARGEVNYAVVTRQTAAGSREFLYRGIPYDRGDDGRYGFAIYTDITEQRRRQQQLTVLHRFLRHNLRNELTVVAGVADALRGKVDDENVAEQVEMLHDRAVALQNVSEKAHAVATALDETDTTATVSLGPRVEDVVDRCRDRYPAAEITARVDRPAEVSASPVLENAIEELVENGVEHNDGDPAVEVTVTAEDDEAVVTVADNGPGIPPTDRAVVFDDADITQLQHGSGLGLWLVRWVTEAAGGRVDHDRSDGWTTVTLSLSRATGDGSSLDGPDS